MCAEAARCGWAALVCAVLLATGCTTLAPGAAANPRHALRTHALERMAGGEYPGEALSPVASSEPDEETRVHRRRSGRELGSGISWPPSWRLGADGSGQLARYMRSSREAALLVCEGGEAAAVALHEARGDVARAQAWLSEARPPRAGPAAARGGAGKGPGARASLVDEAAGLTPEVVEAKLAGVELESTGPRLSSNVVVLEKQRPSVAAAPQGAQGNPLWGEYAEEEVPGVEVSFQ